MPLKPKKIPMRMCISCREMKPKKELIRIVVPAVGKENTENPNRSAILDFNGKVSGRGAYLCHNPECLKHVKKSRAFERALDCTVSDEIWNMLEKEVPSCDQ